MFKVYLDRTESYFCPFVDLLALTAVKFLKVKESVLYLVFFLFLSTNNEKDKADSKENTLGVTTRGDTPD